MAAVENDTFRASCRACETKFTAGLSEIKRHNESAVHKKRMLSFSKQQSLSNWIRPCSTNGTTKEDELDQNVKPAEIRLASLLCEHAISKKSVDYLSEMLKEIFPDSEIAMNVHFHRTKCTSIVTNVQSPTKPTSLALTYSPIY